MKRGKRICKTLKEVRIQVAKANGINYAPSECHHEGDCAGTCPKCEAEVRWLEQQLQLRRQLGKAVAVVGVSMGVVAMASCGGEQSVDSFGADQRGTVPVLIQTVGNKEDATGDGRDTTSVINQALIRKPSVFMGDVIEQQGSFPGGHQALLEFLRENVKYPEQAKKDSISGRVVVGFVVEADGTITDPHIVKSVHPLLDAEALRVAGLMPKWEPCRQNGTAVRVKWNIPVTFKLN